MQTFTQSAYGHTVRFNGKELYIDGQLVVNAKLKRSTGLFGGNYLSVYNSDGKTVFISDKNRIVISSKGVEVNGKKVDLGESKPLTKDELDQQLNSGAEKYLISLDEGDSIKSGVSIYRRIIALRDIVDRNGKVLVKKGEKGGYVESRSCLSDSGTCWVYGKAIVCGEANVRGNAKVSDKALVYGNAQVYDNAEIEEKAIVRGNADIHGEAIISGKAVISGNADISGYAYIIDDVKVSGNANISGSAFLYEQAKVSGNCEISGNVEIRGDVKVSGNYVLNGDKVISKQRHVRDDGSANSSSSANIGIVNNSPTIEGDGNVIITGGKVTINNKGAKIQGRGNIINQGVGKVYNIDNTKE